MRAERGGTAEWGRVGHGKEDYRSGREKWGARQSRRHAILPATAPPPGSGSERMLGKDHALPLCRDAPWGVSGAAVTVPGVGPLGRLRRFLSLGDVETHRGASLPRGQVAHRPPPVGVDAKPGEDPPLTPPGRNLNSLAFQRQVADPTRIETPKGWPIPWRFDLAFKSQAVQTSPLRGLNFGGLPTWR
jgi:hypothetical protein